MQNKKTCLIFDFDGVIADTDLGRYKALRKILEKYDSSLSQRMSKKDFIGLSTKGYLKKYSQTLTNSQIKEIVSKRHDLFFSNLSEYCIPYKNMVESIRYFNSIYELAIVTTNSAPNVTLLLKHLGIFNLFKWVIGREISENEKLVKTYVQIPEILNKQVSECIVIEDSDFGVNAAKKEGFLCIRFDPECIFSKGLEDLKVKSYDELKEIINRKYAR